MLERRVDHRDGRVVVDPHPEVVRPEPDDRHLGPALAQLARAHPATLPAERPSHASVRNAKAVAESGRSRFGECPRDAARQLGERGREGSRMDDRQRLRRTGQGDVELAQARSRRPLPRSARARRRRRGRTRGPSTRAASAPAGTISSNASAVRRRVGERARRDHGEQAVELRAPRGSRRRAARPRRPRRAAAGRRPAGTRAAARSRARSGRAAAARTP